jgi:hypothetical protein
VRAACRVADAGWRVASRVRRSGFGVRSSERQPAPIPRQVAPLACAPEGQPESSPAFQYRVGIESLPRRGSRKVARHFSAGWEHLKEDPPLNEISSRRDGGKAWRPGGLRSEFSTPCRRARLGMRCCLAGWRRLSQRPYRTRTLVYAQILFNAPPQGLKSLPTFRLPLRGKSRLNPPGNGRRLPLRTPNAKPRTRNSARHPAPGSRHSTPEI